MRLNTYAVICGQIFLFNLVLITYYHFAKQKTI